MRVLFLKIAGIVLWSLFLFAPFVARADTGFNVYLPLEIRSGQKTGREIFSLQNGSGFNPGDKESHEIPAGSRGLWLLRLKAERDSIFTQEQTENLFQNQLQHGDGEYRGSYKFGIGLNYIF
ncbi:MAG: hypothetical protein CO093_00325 [Alphaproteobacteria bacterium CG_4_9_14_3_um_filter_47_13]|nr:MAG: hypothetical protein CO093_00325 [Alphaproteobacteria bacterium CG_4_9_14_3_um_filter_47_13]